MNGLKFRGVVMKKRLIISILFVISGGIIMCVSLGEILKGKKETSNALVEAQELVITQKEMNQELFKPKVGETIGILSIPKLEAELPIIEGTNPDELEKGVGHFHGSYFPKEGGQIVLSGHRDTVFRKVGQLKEGDLIEIKVPYGSFQYEITHTKIVDADDRSIITLQNNSEELILTTCYPFHYIGDAPERYIIYAEKK